MADEWVVRKGLIIRPLEGFTNEVLLVDANGKVIASGVTLENITGGISGNYTLLTNNGSDIETMELSGGIPTSLVPDASGAYDLGSPDRPWRELYLTGNTMYLDGQPIAIDGNRLTFQNTKTLAYTDEISASVSSELNKYQPSTVSRSINSASHGFSTGDVVTLKNPTQYWFGFDVGSPVTPGTFSVSNFNGFGAGAAYNTGYPNGSGNYAEFDGNGNITQLHGHIVYSFIPENDTDWNADFSSSGLTNNKSNIGDNAGEGILWILDEGNGFDPDTARGILALQTVGGTEHKVYVRDTIGGDWILQNTYSGRLAQNGTSNRHVAIIRSFSTVTLSREASWSESITFDADDLTDKKIYAGFFVATSSERRALVTDSTWKPDETTTFWTLAQSDDNEKNGLIGVANVKDGNNFDIYTGGYIDFLSGLTEGKIYYLSTTPGEVRSTKPSSGNIIQVYTALSSTEAIIGSTTVVEKEEKATSITFGDLGDVDVTTVPVSAGQYLVYDGTNFVNAYDEYSRSEAATNKTWIDGKRIYRKVLDFGALPNNTSKEVAHGITGLDQFTSISAISTDGTNTLVLPYIGDGTDSINVFRSGSNIRITTNDNRSSHQCDVILEYTKL
jgi:hypothetical protein